MLLGIGWEKNALAETVPKDKQILATGDSNSIRSPIFRYFGKFGMNGRGHSPPRSEIHRRFLIHANQPKTENHNHDLSKLFQTLLERLFFFGPKFRFLVVQSNGNCLSFRLLHEFLLRRGIESRVVSSCLTWFARSS